MTIVITGASRGIGRATAVELGRRGASLALLGRRSHALDEVLSTVKNDGGRAVSVECELRDPGQIEEAARRVLALGTPSVLVNNAGVVRREPIEDATAESWDEQLDVNLRAPFLLTRALLPSMRRARIGRIIHVGSITSTVGGRHAAAYAASKWGLVGFMKSLAEEVSGSGIMTLAILPGSVDTEMLHGSGFPARMTAEDVARTVAYYALEAPLAHNGGVVEMFGT